MDLFCKQLVLCDAVSVSYLHLYVVIKRCASLLAVLAPGPVAFSLTEVCSELPSLTEMKVLAKFPCYLDTSFSKVAIYLSKHKVQVFPVVSGSPPPSGLLCKVAVATALQRLASRIFRV